MAQLNDSNLEWTFISRHYFGMTKISPPEHIKLPITRQLLHFRQTGTNEW